MSQPAEPVVEVVTREELKSGLADGSILLFDVREPHEYAAGHIPGAELMALSQFDPSALPKEDGKRVVFSCATGRRTLAALAAAQAAGRTDIKTHYKGSFTEWAQSGEPVERE